MRDVKLILGRKKNKVEMTKGTVKRTNLIREKNMST